MTFEPSRSTLWFVKTAAIHAEREPAGRTSTNGVTAHSLGFTPVADVSPLAKLTGLRELTLPAGTVTEAQAEELRRKLPNCQIQRE
jgi:hypothetical protein